MAHLIIGHVTESSARVWVRGTGKSKTARLRYREAGGAWTLETRPLVKHRGYVEVIELQGLTPATGYEVALTYQSGGPPPVGRGRFETAPAGAAGFSFFLGSCSIARGPIAIVMDPRRAWAGVESLVKSESPAFMIHCGDQIYADLPGKPPEFMHLRTYRGFYDREWKIPARRRVYAGLPNYMILDDHEIFDNYFVGKPYVGSPSEQIRGAALHAYSEFQHSHNPQSRPAPALYYDFAWGGAAFMVLDVRSERFLGSSPQMIGAVQMSALKTWLAEHRDDVKFVVTSVPFVAELKSHEPDTWCHAPFRTQRDEIVDYLASEGIGRLVFLTGDQHRSYHATLEIERAAGNLVVHELMSSPINQVTGGIGAFETDAPFVTQAGKTRCRVRLDPDEFYGEHSNIMKISVDTNGLVDWSVFRTKRLSSAVCPKTPAPFRL